MEVNEMLTVYSPDMNVYKQLAKTKACTTHIHVPLHGTM